MSDILYPDCIIESFLTIPIEYHIRKIVDENHDIIQTYDINFNHLAKKHHKLGHGQIPEFLDLHRATNYPLYSALVNSLKDICLTIFAKNVEDCIILDIGTYDGMLVAILRNKGLSAFGYEQHPWNDMYDVLNVGEYINPTNLAHVDIAIMLDYAHEFKPDNLLEFVFKICNGIPKVLITDREPRNPHPWNHEYYFNNDVLKQYMIKVFPITASDYTNTVVPEQRRDFLIWSN